MLLCALLPGADAWRKNQLEASRALNFGMPPNQKGREPSPYPRNFRTRSPSKKDARAINSGSAQLHLRMPEDGSAPWALACSEYGERFVCAVRQGQCVATQFHPEKSGTASGLKWQLRAGEKTQQPGHNNTSSSDSLEDIRGNPKRSAQFRHIHCCISINVGLILQHTTECYIAFSRRGGSAMLTSGVYLCNFLPPLQIAFDHLKGDTAIHPSASFSFVARLG